MRVLLILLGWSFPLLTIFIRYYLFQFPKIQLLIMHLQMYISFISSMSGYEKCFSFKNWEVF